MQSATSYEQLALIPYVAQRSPGEHIGRTQLMKYLYFLKAIRKVPVPYCFTLYSYGPFDSKVLGDLGTAESLGLVASSLELYGSGYGYRIESQMPEEEILEFGGNFISEYKDDLDWVVNEFGPKSTSDLELESTLLFVYESQAVKERSTDLEHVATLVNEVKPHFSREAIIQRAHDLVKRGFLRP